MFCIETDFLMSLLLRHIKSQFLSHHLYFLSAMAWGGPTFVTFSASKGHVI